MRNLRASQTAELRLGRRRQAVHATEIADADKVDILRAYLRRWRWEVGQFFQGVGPDASDAELAGIARAPGLSPDASRVRGRCSGLDRRSCPGRSAA